MTIRFSGTQHIAVPKEKVFDVLTSFDSPRNWMKGFIRIEVLKGGNKAETGAVWRATRKMFGKEATEEFEAVSVTPYREIKMQIDGTKGSSKKGMYYFQYILQDKDGGTDLTMNGEVAGLRGIMVFFFKLFIRFFKKSLMKDLKTLKEYLETGKKVE